LTILISKKKYSCSLEHLLVQFLKLYNNTPDMILIAPKILTMQSGKPFFDNGAIVIKRGVVLAVGPLSLLDKYPGQRIYCLKDSVLLPGLVNVHTHLELPPLLKTIQTNDFSSWVLNLIHAKKHLREKDYIRATTDNILSCIQTGTTTVGEICTHNISSVLLKSSGLRAIVYHEIIGMARNSSKFIVHSSGKKQNSNLIQFGLSPHTPYTVSEAILSQISKQVRKNNIPLAMHIAESKDEIKLLQGKKCGLEKLYAFAGWETSQAPHANSSFEYLDSIGLLSRNMLAVHAVQTAHNNISLLKKKNVAIAHCPRSNEETGVGKMDLRNFLDAGIRVGLGTDSLASSPSLNMWDEMRFALRVHKKDSITAKDILRLATLGGAEALSLDAVTGSIMPGKRADIIALPLPEKNTGDLYSDLIRETKNSNMTMVNGKLLYTVNKMY
jgi:cytosine/adenosine deaminase-related metal-dependent hydrolase